MDSSVRKARKGVCAAFAMIVAMSLTPASSQASVMHDASYNTGVYEALGDQYQGTAMWMTSTLGGQTVQFSGVRIDPWYAVTVAHGFWSGSNITTTGNGGFGDSILGNPGLTVGIDEVHFHPTWNGNLSQVLANGWADLAVVRFDQAVLGPTIDIGSLALGEMYDTVGFGHPGTPGLGWLPDDNARRGIHQYADQYGFPPNISSNYIRSRFEPLSFRNDLLAGGGGPGNSGSGGFDVAGDLAALAVATSGAPNMGMSTYNLRLDLYDPWIQTIVPEPSTLTLLLFAAFAVKRHRR